MGPNPKRKAVKPGRGVVHDNIGRTGASVGWWFHPPSTPYPKSLITCQVSVGAPVERG